MKKIIVSCVLIVGFSFLCACDSTVPQIVTEETEITLSDENATEEVENVVMESDSEEEESQEETSESDEEVEHTIQAVDTAVNLLSESKESNPHNPLSIGEWGSGMARGSYGLESMCAVRLDAVYTGKEAAALVAKYGTYKSEALAGTSFEVAEFTYTCDPTQKYMDVRFEGADGEKLKQRGISYSMRTYDIWDEVVETQAGVYAKIYVYYEVPTGCEEYMLEVGENAANGANTTACYLIDK